MSKFLDEYTQINPERTEMIRAACGKITADGHAVDYARLCENLPPDFALSRAQTVDPWAEIAIAETGVTASINTTEGGYGASLADVELIETPDELRARVVALDHKASDLRSKIFSLRNRAATARGNLADAISSFVSGHGPKISQQDNVRAELAASLATRASQAHDADTAPMPVAGPSTLDRSAMWSGHQGSSNGDGTDFLRKQMRNGGFRRGSTPAAYKGAATKLRNPA
jgi:hypothetical protein